MYSVLFEFCLSSMTRLVFCMIQGQTSKLLTSTRRSASNHRIQPRTSRPELDTARNACVDCPRPWVDFNADSRMLICDSVDTRIKVISRTLLDNSTLKSYAVAQCQGCHSMCNGTGNMKKWFKRHWPACIPRTHTGGRPAPTYKLIDEEEVHM